jgi:hypothetical protein
VPGTPGFVDAYVRSSILLSIPGGLDGGVFATCDEGDIATGGGFSTYGELGALRVYDARPDDPENAVVEDGAQAPTVPSSYRVRAVNDTAEAADLQAWVMCLDVTG